MFQSLIFSITIFVAILTRPVVTLTPKVLSEANYSLSNRYQDSFVNSVFSDNILLTLAYMSGKVKKGKPIEWNKVKTSSVSKIILKPGQTFAFHDITLEKYKNKIALTTNAHFNYSEGFRSDGWLVGDGVCHLASFMYVVSKKAGLVLEAPTRHDFAKIPDVEKEAGVSIFNTSATQNLYVTNNLNKTIAFVFTHKQNNLNIKVEQFN